MNEQDILLFKGPVTIYFEWAESREAVAVRLGSGRFRDVGRDDPLLVFGFEAVLWSTVDINFQVTSKVAVGSWNQVNPGRQAESQDGVFGSGVKFKELNMPRLLDATWFCAGLRTTLYAGVDGCENRVRYPPFAVCADPEREFVVAAAPQGGHAVYVLKKINFYTDDVIDAPLAANVGTNCWGAAVVASRVCDFDRCGGRYRRTREQCGDDEDGIRQ